MLLVVVDSVDEVFESIIDNVRVCLFNLIEKKLGYRINVIKPFSVFLFGIIFIELIIGFKYICTYKYDKRIIRIDVLFLIFIY